MDGNKALTGLLSAAALALATTLAGAQTVELRYGHMNPPTSAAGIQANMLAEAIAKNTNGQIKVTVYPSSQLGKLQRSEEHTSELQSQSNLVCRLLLEKKKKKKKTHTKSR